MLRTIAVFAALAVAVAALFWLGTSTSRRGRLTILGAGLTGLGFYFFQFGVLETYSWTTRHYGLHPLVLACFWLILSIPATLTGIFLLRRRRGGKVRKRTHYPK
jgi:lipopolysaccharide export LptBFGC system permease protein LptF